MTGLQIIYLIFLLIPVLEVLLGVFLVTGTCWFVSKTIEIWRKYK